MRVAIVTMLAACSATAPAPSPHIALPAPVARERPVFEQFGYRVVDFVYLPYMGMTGDPPPQHTREPADPAARACVKQATGKLAAFLTSDSPKLRRLLELGGYTQSFVVRLDDYGHARYRYQNVREARLVWGDNVWTWNATLDDQGACNVPSAGAATAAVGNLLYSVDPDQPDDRTKPAKMEVIVREYGSERPLAGVPVGIHETLVCPQWEDDDKCPVPARMSGVTDKDGVARFDLPHPRWGVDVIQLAGFVTRCPYHDASDSELEHYLTEDSHEGFLSPRTMHRYVCRLVRPSSLRVNSANAAIRIAKEIPAIKAWLAQHPDADVSARSEVTSWEVTGSVAERGAWRAVIDAIDGSYYTNGP